MKLEDEISDASSVLLDHRKKRIKRMARFWLGEGFVKGKPHLRQPPWAWKAQSALANLIEDLPRAYQKELGSGAVWNPRELLEFLRQRLEMLRGKLINQKARLSEEVALDTEDFSPVIRTKKDQNRLEVEALICQQLCDFRAALEALSNSLQTLLEDFAFKEDELQNFKVEPPSEVEATPSAASAVSEAAPAQNQFLFTEAERKRAYRCVSWTEDCACLEAWRVAENCREWKKEGEICIKHVEQKGWHSSWNSDRIQPSSLKSMKFSSIRACWCFFSEFPLFPSMPTILHQNFPGIFCSA